MVRFVDSKRRCISPQVRGALTNIALVNMTSRSTLPAFLSNNLRMAPPLPHQARFLQQTPCREHIRGRGRSRCNSRGSLSSSTAPSAEWQRGSICTVVADNRFATHSGKLPPATAALPEQVARVPPFMHRVCMAVRKQQARPQSPAARPAGMCAHELRVLANLCVCVCVSVFSCCALDKHGRQGI